MEQTKIYIVTSGEYSDYSIEAVFSTVALAEYYIQQNGTECRIEEYNLDEEIVKENKLWKVFFNLKNNKFDSATAEKLNNNLKNDTCGVFEVLSQKYIGFYVDSDSMDKAVKIAYERFVAIKANRYIWQRLMKPYGVGSYGYNKYEIFNIKTNTFAKNDVL